MELTSPWMGYCQFLNNNSTANIDDWTLRLKQLDRFLAISSQVAEILWTISRLNSEDFLKFFLRSDILFLANAMNNIMKAQIKKSRKMLKFIRIFVIFSTFSRFFIYKFWPEVSRIYLYLISAKNIYLAVKIYIFLYQSLKGYTGIHEPKSIGPGPTKFWKSRTNSERSVSRPSRLWTPELTYILSIRTPCCIGQAQKWYNC